MRSASVKVIRAESPGKVIVRSISNLYALWFANSRSFVLLQEPAFEVYRLSSEGNSIRKIKAICQEKFGHLEEDIPRFVTEIIQYIRYCQNPKHAGLVSKTHKLQTLPLCSKFYSEVHYRMGSVKFTIRYQHEYMKLAVHPLISHLETTPGNAPEKHIECIEQNRLLILTSNGLLIAAFRKKDFELYRGAISQQIYSLIYDREFGDWMMILHASGVIANNQAILFSAAAGSGKSTLAALLKAYGYGYISDDFVGAVKNGNVFPYPSAISVKEGSVETLTKYFPELKFTVPEATTTGKAVRYLPVVNLSDESANGYPVSAVVFVSYAPDEDFAFDELTVNEALPLVLKETWVNPSAEMITSFFDWMLQVRFYRLRYSQTKHALESIRKITQL